MYRMPQSPEQRHGGAVRAAVGGSIAPGGKDHPFCMQNPLGRGEKKSALVLAHAGHLGITAGLYPLIVAGKAQSVQYRCGSVAHRVYAPLRIRPAADPKPAEKGFRIGLGKDLRCLGQGAVIVVQLPVDVAEIASAVSGEQQLFPTRGSRSSRVTCVPARAAVYAAVMPDAPPPMTAICVCVWVMVPSVTGSACVCPKLFSV